MKKKAIQQEVEELKKRIAILEMNRNIQIVPYYPPIQQSPCPYCGKYGLHTCVTWNGNTNAS